MRRRKYRNPTVRNLTRLARKQKKYLEKTGALASDYSRGNYDILEWIVANYEDRNPKYILWNKNQEDDEMHNS